MFVAVPIIPLESSQAYRQQF